MRRDMKPEELHLTADASFWPETARAVHDFAVRMGAPDRQLQSITWIVPGGTHAGLARAAFVHRFAGRPFIPPRIVPMTEWLGPLRAGTRALAELFSALRSNAWVRGTFGGQPAALWALARDVSALCDELSLAAVDGAEALEGRLQASLVRHFHRRASRALQPQAQLVLQLWRARLRDDDGAACALRELAARADRARTPLAYLGAGLATAADRGIEGWELAFLQGYAKRAPVLLIVPDAAAALNARPQLAAAWPELAGAGTDVPIAARADALRGSGTPEVPLAIVPAASLEEEAAAVADQVLAWRRAGVESIALVALDRLTARRVRALLERAQVNVRDETGWKLSTTSAAAAVMRWYDLVVDDLYWRDLLDWLKSTFTLAGRPNKPREVFAFERAIRAGGALQGARACRRALAGSAPDVADADLAGAREVLALIEAQVQATPRSGVTLAAHVRSLRRTLDALGMQPALVSDPVGRSLLREFELLESEVSAISARATLAEFRALLTARLEEAAFVDSEIESPVVMVSLTAATPRGFDAALLIGADAQHLPVAPQELLFMSNAVRAELGLVTTERALRSQAAQLAVLIATTPRVVATWRTRHSDEPNAISPLLERLQFIAQRSMALDLTHAPVRQAHNVAAEVLERPAPAAARMLPQRLSASHAQSLTDCAYQFYARRMLQLREPDDVIEFPDKRDFGLALHQVLHRFHREWGGTAFHELEPARLAESLRVHARNVFDAQIERNPGMLAFARRFDGLVDGYLDWLRQHSASGWRWTAGEEARVCQLTLRDGRAVELTGRIDRIDARQDAAGPRELLLVDYKARAADDLKRGLQVPGEDVQLPFYGLLLENGAHAAAYLGFGRGKEGDSGVRQIDAPRPFGDLVAAVGTRLHADLQRIHEGAPLPAIGANATCEYCEMRGLCRRDYWQHDDEAADA